MPSDPDAQVRDSNPSKETDGDDASFIRTEDIICLVCTSGDAMKRGYLAAEGFGSQLCHLEPEPRNQEPSELWKCTFQLEEALSVHAMHTHGLMNREKKQGSRRILMYGQAVLLRHVATKKLLRCLTTTPTGDKMAYDIGFTDNPDRSCMNESCWYTVHPASKQRSEGEKVRAGDDIFLVSVANERYLSAQLSSFQNPESDSLTAGKQPLNTVQASFVPCVWALHIVCSGSAKKAAVGYVNGGDVVRLLHRHGDEECLAVAARNSDKCVITDRNATELCYEPPVAAHLRSLWRVELFKMRFGGGFASWGQPFRLRHVVTGKFLGVKVVRHDGGTEGKDGEEERLVRNAVLLDPSEASREASEFCFANTTMSHMTWSELKLESMGTPQVKFGDSEVFILHKASGKFVGCPVSERVRHWSLRGARRVFMQGETHQSFAFTVTRASEEQAKAASIVQLTEDVMRNYVHKMLLSCERVPSGHLSDKLLHVLSDLLYYFRMPNQCSLSHDHFQHMLCVLKERQALFQKQGMLLFTLAVIVETGKRCHPSSPATEQIHHCLYELLAAMIRGNRSNCREFATQKWLAIFVSQLSMPKFTHDVLEVIQCLLTDSPEVLNIISERHIETIVSLLHTNGRDAKVMKLLSSLCVCHGVAMRDKQRLICKHLLNCRDLLLQTSLHDQVHCVHPSVYVGLHKGSAMFHRWYFEIEITQLALRADRQPHFRVGWACASLFSPQPSSNSLVTTSGGVGDDMFSIGFDGVGFWVGGHRLGPSHAQGEKGGTKRLKRQVSVCTRDPPRSPQPPCGSVSVGDVIGCCLDLEVGMAWFMLNGHVVPGKFQTSHWKENITPAVSFSAGVSAVMSFGGHLGKLQYGPPTDFSSLVEAAEPGRDVKLQPFLTLGTCTDLIVSGPSSTADHLVFVPAPINTAKVTLPDSVMNVREKLAKNIHEVWAKGKIEAGYAYGKVRDDALKHNPSLKPFEDLSKVEQQYDYSMALETLATLVTLGYKIGSQESGKASLPYQDLPPEVYQLSNGYLPRPLNLTAVQLDPGLHNLVEKLAENAHNVWAASRIKEGWTYGMANDAERKRNCLLVPYPNLDASAKKSNLETALEAVKTIVALGCTIEPPSSFQGAAIHQLRRNFTSSHVEMRTFRGQSCYRLRTGKWYYEVKLLTSGMMRIGWATRCFPAGALLGADEHSYAYDGYLACKWHNNTSETFGLRWKAGDVVGCLLDLSAMTMAFTLNGELLEDSVETTLAFERVKGHIMPAITLAAGERAQINFGRSEDALAYDYTHSGYEPVCSPSSLHYNVPLWYTSPHSAYEIIDHAHSRLAPKRLSSELNKAQVPCLASPPPLPAVISLTCKDWDYSMQAQRECLRLNLGVMVSPDGDVPATPTLHPRPGPLAPSLTQVSSVYQELGAEYFAPRRLTVSFSVVIPAGQDPSVVFIGWTTAGFRYIESQFHSSSWKNSSPDSILPHTRFGQHVEFLWRKKSASVSDGFSEQKEPRKSISAAFIICLNDLLPHSEPSLAVPVRVSCRLNTMSGRMLFTSSATDSRKVSLVTSGQCKLFPTVVTTPTTEHFLDFDLSEEKGCQALTSALIAMPQADASVPPLPPRVKLMALARSQWVRQPTNQASFSILPTSGGAFKLSSDKEPVYSMYITLPEEDVTMGFLEISEDEKLKQFHVQTLKAYAAISSHCNYQLASAIGQVVDPDQLLQCLRTEGLSYSVSSAYFSLASSLHLQAEVAMRLMMRGEFIVPLSQCTKSISLFPAAPQRREEQVYRVTMAPLPGLHPAQRNQTNISHNITSTFSQTAVWKSITFPVEQLKELVFSNLERLLVTRSYTGYLLPCQGSHEIFVPLLNVLDQLLVLGELQEETDLKRFLALLDPQEFAVGRKPFPHGLLSMEVACEEPIKQALCQLLQHLCDCQVQHRIEAIVTFARGYVESLQGEQKERHRHNFTRRPKEFRSSPEKQVESMLSFRDASGDSPLGKRLRESLRAFHGELTQHCGCVDSKSLSATNLEDKGIGEKLKKLVQVVLVSEEQCKRRCEGDKVTTLQKLITRTMISWASTEIHRPELIAEVFLLLYRQYDEVHEVVQAMRKTYVIDVLENKGEVNYDLDRFRKALGYIRLLLKVGMGKKEEEHMKNALRMIRNSAIFYCHPHLLRQLGVHSTVLELMQSYLGISSGSGKSHVLTFRRKQRLCMRGLPPPVEACCKFLCKFAKISQENQRALFPHIGYLLEHSEKHPGLMTYKGCTPLDVVTSTIKDNYELALALKDSHLEHVVSLLIATTTSMSSCNDSGEDDVLGMVNLGSISCDWAPNGGEKCLDFLQSAVWVDNEEIQENAYVIVRLLIRNSECLGPALAGEAVGLLRVYEEAIDHLEDISFSSSPPDATVANGDSQSHTPLRYQESSVSLASSSLSRKSTILDMTSLNSRLVLSFYSSLVRLLACCAPPMQTTKGSNHPGTGHTPLHFGPETLGATQSGHMKRSVSQRTRNILQNMIKEEEVVGILSLPYSSGDEKNGLGPAHKEAVLLFLNRVYGVTGQEVLLRLLTDAFLPDIKLALKLLETGNHPQLCLPLCRYLCMSVLPLLTKYAAMFHLLLSHLHVIDNLLVCLFRLVCSSQLSCYQMEEVATFLITVTQELDPRAVFHITPKIIGTIPSLQPHTVVSFKLLTSQYTHFAKYYETGLVGKSNLRQASEEEKAYSAVIVHRLIDALAKKLPPDPSLLRHSIACLKAVICALGPECLVPSVSQLSVLCDSSSTTYDPRPIDTGRVMLCSDLRTFAHDFAIYQHDCYSYEKQSVGWVYGPVFSEEKSNDPLLRPFDSLLEQDQTAILTPVEDTLKYLLARGWTLSKVRALDTQNIPKKPKMTCIRRKKKRAQSFNRQPEEDTTDFSDYEPLVLDLSKVEAPVELLALAEAMAEYAHDKWSRELKLSSTDYRSHPLFLPYELLDEVVKEERRTYALDLLRYLRLAGFEPCRTRVSIPTLVHGSHTSLCHEKFALQLFEKFKHLLSQGLERDFYLKVAFPVLTSYLTKHSGYFMPACGAERMHSFGSREEKAVILQLFCCVAEFSRQHTSSLFPSPGRLKDSLGAFGHSPLGGQGDKGAESDANTMASKVIVSLMEAIIKSLDFKAIFQGSPSAHACSRSRLLPQLTEQADMIEFFHQASSSVHNTTKIIAKPDKLEVQVRFQFHCLNVLIPTLTTLFRHLGIHRTGRTVIAGSILNHCRYIFQSLVEMASGSAPVFVGSCPLVAIGQCMGGFALAFPDPFLEKSMFGISMDYLLEQLKTATTQGVTCGNVLYVADVIVPVLASYITRWWGNSNSGDLSPLSVNHVDEVLSQVLALIAGHFGMAKVPWFHRVIENSLLLAGKCSLHLLSSHFIPLLDELRERAIGLWQDEQYLSATGHMEKAVERQEALVEDYRVFVRDLTAVLPYLVVFLRVNHDALCRPLIHISHSSSSCPSMDSPVKRLLVSVGDIFYCWFSSQHFRREFQSGTLWLVPHARRLAMLPSVGSFSKQGGGEGRYGADRAKQLPNLIIVSLEVLFPLNDHFLSQRDRELVNMYRVKMGKKGATPEELKLEIIRDLETHQNQPLTHKLVRQFSRRFVHSEQFSLEEKALEILSLAKVKFHLHQVEHPVPGKNRWKQLLTHKRRRAIVDCFLAVPYFQLKKHRAINLFLQSYCSSWLMNAEHANHDLLTEELLDHQDWLAARREERGEFPSPDPLSQLFTMFKRKASAGECGDAGLYTAYASVLSKCVIGSSEEDSRLANDHPTKAYELYSQWKVKLLEKQDRLARRGVATMVLLVITATNGSMCPVVHSSLQLGIALLKEGNQRIQQEMLEQLKGMDVGFLSSVSSLISSCSVLDWNAYERYNKSTDPSQGASTSHRVLPEASFTASLFLFLQLLCEGHNLAFQNYLRTQAGNTTTVNIIICSVDYLLRLQESISDFYWHYSDYEIVDLHGRENFLKAFKVARQVFRTLTEYIQGPCVKNQEALACSRLWDTVSGFLQIFAVLEKKLYKDTSQMELLRELLDLQEELYILLLSMLEGSAMSSNIGRLMVDMLMESAQSIEEIMAFFAIFVKLKDQLTSKAFKDYDLNKDGLISFREFEKAMEAQQRYTKEEVAYLMECADTNHDGLLDYTEFTERFHNPAEHIGFYLCILIVHLSDHLPHDKRLRHFHNLPRGKELMEHFKQNMGCIEILGKSKRIERVYFEVRESRLRQFEETQIQESKRNFLHTVETGSHKNKLQGFISFCEDTIFEMDYADKISGTEQTERERKAEVHRGQHTKALQLPSHPFMSRIRFGMSSLRSSNNRPFHRVIVWMSMVWVFILAKVVPTCKAAGTYLKENIPAAYYVVRRKLARPGREQGAAQADSSPSKLQERKRVGKRGSLRLIIPPPVPRPEGTLSAIPEHVSQKPQDEPRRFSHDPFSSSFRASDARRRSSITPHTPRPFQLRHLKLEYDRSTMKRPSQYPETPSSDSAHGDKLEGLSAGDSYVPKIMFSSRGWQSFLARNYYRLNNFKLLATFFINIILLMFQVQSFSTEREEEEANHCSSDAAGLGLQDDFWVPLTLYCLSLLHFLLSAVLILSYLHLKVPLIIFRREKHVSRQLESKQMWVLNPPESLADRWDSIVVSAHSFPLKYWDKQAKQRVCEQFSPEQRPAIARRLGLLRKSKFEEKNKWDVFTKILHSLADVRYLVWVLGVVLSNVLILYHIGYCLLSFMGLQWNSFYYSIHLLDLVMNFKLLRTVLRSVLHNGKQLAMTVLMTCVVIYIYTVIAFNFFRKFYREYNTVGQAVYNCESMARCFVYHIDQGLRSGGGIADVLAPASGDPSEFLRLIFDITFFFFVIVILLAIIQGLIIDAFGELRDREEFITMEMQTKCFVCGLPKTEFDHIPHGFDNHITREHNMAHYMFFLLYLIKKQESEFSGQESYVWEMYLKRNWDFFPVGNCFYKQEKEKEHQQLHPHVHVHTPAAMLTRRALVF